MTSSDDDGKYYQSILPGSLSEKLMIRARDRIYADFISHMTPKRTEDILDVGISDVINNAANVLERNYPYQDRITACGLSDAAEFRREFPRCAYRRIEANVRLPFADESFAVATSNAVLEHVGSSENQKFNIRELCRVATRVFISVPHRYFPIEHHTALPLLHYGDLTFRLACRATRKSEWCQEENLILMTRDRLRRLVDGLDRRVEIGYTGLRMGPLSSNLFVSIT